MSFAVRIFSVSVLWGILLLAVGFSQPARDQKSSDSTTLSLTRLTRQSGYIFTGTVTGVEPVAPQSSSDVASVRVTFSVEHAVRGVLAGQKLVMREWAGAWDSGGSFRPGERVLIFLYPPSRLGLTSTVGGTLGRFPVDQDGKVLVQRGPSSRGRVRVSERDFARDIQRAAEE